jgi:hypothetical protein
MSLLAKTRADLPADVRLRLLALSAAKCRQTPPNAAKRRQTPPNAAKSSRMPLALSPPLALELKGNNETDDNAVDRWPRRSNYVHGRLAKGFIQPDKTVPTLAPAPPKIHYMRHLTLAR